jgi:hypothetical protein
LSRNPKQAIARSTAMILGDYTPATRIIKPRQPGKEFIK